MATITYNAKIQFKDKADFEYWSSLLDCSRKAYNLCSTLLDTAKIHLDLKSVHNAVYSRLRQVFPIIPSQGVIKIYKECLSAYRSISSNGQIKHKLPKKTNLSMRLDKRLYSKLSVDSISLCSGRPCKRSVAEIVKFNKLVELFKKYPTHDPLIFKKGDIFYLSIPFEIQETPLQNEQCVGIDVGERRFIVSSDGILFNDKDYNFRKRKLRYLKRCLQKKRTKSAIRHCKKLSSKEKHQSVDMCNRLANAVIHSTRASIIVLEDLKNLKNSTAKTKNGHIRKSHNRRISQIPFYRFKQILTYKALLNGKVVETVSPYMTSQTDCITNKKEGFRKNRRFYSVTGIVLDADWNAAINIARKSKHPFSFSKPLDGSLKTWRAGCMLNSQSYVSPINT